MEGGARESIFGVQGGSSRDKTTIYLLEERIDNRVSSFEERIDKRINSLEERIDKRITALDQKMDQHFRWTVGIQVAVLLAVLGVLFQIALR